MFEESLIREEVRKESSAILYEDENYIIGISKLDTDAHNILVGNSYVFLARGIFNELARADTKRLESALAQIEPTILHELKSKNISLEELGWTLAKAAIKDQEEYAGFVANSRRP